LNKKSAIYLDVDGVLNQYNYHERKKRHLVHKASGFKDEFDPFNPYLKKIQKLSSIVKRYDVDVYLFSAWSLEKLQPFIPFKLKGDTNKIMSNVIDIMPLYTQNILIEDEYKMELFGKDRLALPKGLSILKINGEVGMINKDFNKLRSKLEGKQ
jgi:hypothetical protein